MKKPRGDAKLKTLPDALQAELFQLLRSTTNEKAAAWLEKVHGVTTSAGALSEFFSWYPRQGWLKQSASFADSLSATIAKLPQLKISAAAAQEVAQVAFELQAAQDRDPKLFAMLYKGKVTKATLELERERFEWAKKEDWEKGIDALLVEAKDIPAARKLIEQAHDLIKKARG